MSRFVVETKRFKAIVRNMTIGNTLRARRELRILSRKEKRPNIENRTSGAIIDFFLFYNLPY